MDKQERSGSRCAQFLHYFYFILWFITLRQVSWCFLTLFRNRKPQKRENSDVAVRIRKKEQVFEIMEALREGGFSYRGVDVRRPTLEEVFLNLTGSKLSEEGDE